MPAARPSLLPILLLAALLPGPALAQPQLGGIITGRDVERIGQILSVYGTAERQPDDADGPWFRGQMDGITYTFSLLNCTQGADCTSAQFRAVWTSDGAHSIEMMNTWNRGRRFSDAYIDSNGNATIEFDVNLAGGVTAVNFDDTVQWWQAVLGDFRTEVIDPGYAAAPRPQMRK